MRYTAFVLGLIALLAAAPAAFALQHAHPAPAATVGPAPANGYTTDATLRREMRAIRTEIDRIADAQQREATQPVVQAASRIIDNVNTIIVNCKLPPDADATLHAIIGPMLQDAGALRADPGKTDAVAGLRKALADYAHQFDDPDFSASGGSG